MDDAPQKFDRFHPAMPHIPGVSDQPQKAPEHESARQRKLIPWLIVALVAVLVVGGTIAWKMVRSPFGASGDIGETSAMGQPNGARVAHVSAQRLPAEIADLSELARPWASKKFRVRDPRTNEDVAAMVVRLPGAGNRSASYWAFSLRAPFGHCELEYLAGLATLSQKYGYRATHPMVANPCTGTVYDPLRLGTLPGGAWARGEIVHGSGLRPPIAIEIQIQRNQVVASQIE